MKKFMLVVDRGYGHRPVVFDSYEALLRFARSESWELGRLGVEELEKLWVKLAYEKIVTKGIATIHSTLLNPSNAKEEAE